MSRWRRFIAVLLLVTFVPGSTLAAMPLVWCVANESHRAIEHAPMSGAKHVNHAVLGGHKDGLGQLAAGDDNGCQDWQLMDKTKSANAPTGGVLTLDLRNVVSLPSLPDVQPLSRDPPWSLHAGAAPVPDQQRTMRRSVVLLI